MWIDRRKLYFQKFIFFMVKCHLLLSVKYEFMILAIIILSVMRAINTSHQANDISKK